MMPVDAAATVVIEPMGDATVLIRLGNRVDLATHRRVHALATALQAQRPDWLRELTPAYASLALHVDPARLPSDDPLTSAQRWLREWLAHARLDAEPQASAVVEIPVLYGGAGGPDLPAIAARAGISQSECCALHCHGDYTVAMLGFAPGFPYLLGLDPRLHAPRHATPRARVAAGSIGIGGGQTGIYPFAGPGGWQLIGRTPRRLFDAGRDPPSLLRPGDQVRFVAIDAKRFAALDEHSR